MRTTSAAACGNSVEPIRAAESGYHGQRTDRPFHGPPTNVAARGHSVLDRYRIFLEQDQGTTAQRRVWDHYQRYRRTLYVLGTPAKSYEKQQGMLKTVNRAIQEHRRLEIEYQSIGKPVQTRVIEPYGVVIYQSSIYVIATEEARDGEGVDRLKHWKLDRFQAATPWMPGTNPMTTSTSKRTSDKRSASFPGLSQRPMRFDCRRAPLAGCKKTRGMLSKPLHPTPTAGAC